MAGYQPDIYASIAITFAVAAVALACRLTARRITKQKYWFDDYFAVVAFVRLVGRSYDESELSRLLM
jgi:hypothetical protein